MAIGPNGGISKGVWYANGSMIDSKVYQQTIRLAFEPKVPHGHILQQNNAPCHLSKDTKKYFASKTTYPVLPDWPPRSCDLNPIENLWAYLKCEIDSAQDMNLEKKLRTSRS